jgi:hypothetical protein
MADEEEFKLEYSFADAWVDYVRDNQGAIVDMLNVYIGGHKKKGEYRRENYWLTRDKLVATGEYDGKPDPVLHKAVNAQLKIDHAEEVKKATASDWTFQFFPTGMSYPEKQTMVSFAYDTSVPLGPTYIADFDEKFKDLTVD